jgi:peptidyl-prolyl cis-trans isomerase SurA
MIMKPSCTLVLIGSLLLAGAHPVQAQIRFGPDSTDPGERLDTIVAVVDDDVITQAELNRSLADTRRQLRSRGVDPPPQPVLERQVLERLIIDRLLQRAATRAGIVVDDPTLNAAVESIARQNDMNLSQLRAAVERDGTDFATFREDIRRQVEAQRLRQQVIDPRLTVTELEIDNALLRTDLGVTAGEAQRAEVREALLRRKAEEEWDLWLRQLRDQAYVEIRLQ